jgi:hypothetical protein
VAEHTLGYRLFRVGRIPASVRTEIVGETVLFEAEGIPVHIHQAGRVPGAIKHRGITLLSGALVITDRRLIGTGRRGKLADVPFDVQAEGPATITAAEDGLHVDFDLARIHRSFRGEMRIDFNAEIPGNVLAQLPWSVRSFPVTNPQAVMRTFGSRRSL